MSLVENVGRKRTRCPRCDGTMAAVRSGESLLAGCGKCRGVWVDRAAFDRICKRESKGAAGGRFGTAQAWRGNRAKGSAVGKGLKCPVCYHWMEAKSFENCPDLVVDVCQRHGTWLNADELQAILLFVKGRNVPEGSAAGSGVGVVGAAAVAATISGLAPAVASGSGRQDRSALEWGGDLAMDVLDLALDIGVNLGDAGNVGDVVGGVAELAGALFSGL